MKKLMLTTSTFLLGVAVLLGAVGAHALKHKISPEALGTFETGVRYFLVHAAALMTMGFQEHFIQEKVGLFTLKIFLGLIFIGLICFSGGCMMYAVTGIKTFAHMAPIGGMSFIFAWFFLSFNFWKKMH